jgi:uncharacterized repeat protein (TIGR03803 family)
MRISRNILAALALWAPYGLAQSPSLTTLYSFTGSSGGGPYSSPVVNSSGVMYGAASNGGSSNDGVVYELAYVSGLWTETVLHNFTGYPNDGQTPYGMLLSGKSGTLYGTSANGGSNGQGAVFAMIPPSSSGGAWTERLIYSFAGKQVHQDGSKPHGGVVAGAKGVLYGTTADGGANGGGTAFQLTPPATGKTRWTEAVLHRFTGANGDGSFPQAGLVIDSHGALYGTTEAGGSGCACGVVFQLTPPTTTGGAWTENILHSFAGSTDGAFPEAGLVMDSHGALYGTTYQGGPAGFGTVFQLTPPAAPGMPWTMTTLYAFGTGGDAAYPFAGLVFGSNGALYGASISGGTLGQGAIFELAPPATAGGVWTESVLYSFSGASDGGAPYAGLVPGQNGTLVGTTSTGGSAGMGTVFQLTL